ncbi:hypothetical protein B484DRAFT_230723, partial [Ochromonadaceae sp. CCMP2298]
AGCNRKTQPSLAQTATVPTQASRDEFSRCVAEDPRGRGRGGFDSAWTGFFNFRSNYAQVLLSASASSPGAPGPVPAQRACAAQPAQQLLLQLRHRPLRRAARPGAPVVAASPGSPGQPQRLRPVGRAHQRSGSQPPARRRGLSDADQRRPGHHGHHRLVQHRPQVGPLRLGLPLAQLLQPHREQQSQPARQPLQNHAGLRGCPQGPRALAGLPVQDAGLAEAAAQAAAAQFLEAQRWQEGGRPGVVRGLACRTGVRRGAHTGAGGEFSGAPLTSHYHPLPPHPLTPTHYHPPTYTHYHPPTY